MLLWAVHPRPQSQVFAPFQKARRLGACLTSREGANIPQDEAVGEKGLILDPAGQNSLTDGLRNMPSLLPRSGGLMSQKKDGSIGNRLLFLYVSLIFKGSKQKSQAQNTSLMHSESELDSDEAIFTWPDREKGKLLHGQNGFLRNGQVILKPKNQREEIL